MSEDKYCTQCNKVLPVHTTWCQYYQQLEQSFGERTLPQDHEVSVLLEVPIKPLPANAIQIGGEHYKKGGEEHWDRAWRLKYDPFQYIITKWVERWKDKGGVEDLKKAQHAIQKYIEVVTASRPEQGS